MLSEDGDLLKTIVEQTVQQVLEAEMDEALQAGKGEPIRGWARSSYASRRIDKGGSGRKCLSAIGAARKHS